MSDDGYIFGLVHTESGRCASGKDEYDMIRNANLKNHEMIFVWNDKKEAYDRYDNQTLENERFEEGEEK